MEVPILLDILIIFLLSIVVVLVFSRLKIPSLVGFLLTGILAGPHGFKLVSNIHGVEILAEIGVILLLFTIGIEFSLKSLVKIKKVVFIGGGIQVLMTVFVVAGILFFTKMPFNKSVFLGFVVALSSTAIAIKLLQDKGEIDSSHGRNAFAISIFQDISSIPLILLIPILAGTEQSAPTDIILIIIKALGVVVISYLLARLVIPRLLYQVTLTRSNELFILTIIAICFSVAALTNYAGLSIAFGAFLAGLIISESEYSTQAIGKILPFRDIFLSLFFVSMGMLLNVEILFSKPVLILLLTLGVMLLKAIIIGFSVFVVGYPLRASVLTALLVSQIGEFSFIIAGIGLHNRLISEEMYQLILAVAVISMGTTPFIFKIAPSFADFLMKMPIPSLFKSGLNPLPDEKIPEMKNHLIIVGYGTNGQNVAKAAQYAGIPYIIIEMNPETVRTLNNDKVQVIFGDAAQSEVLKHAFIENAMAIVIAVPDSANALRITQQSSVLNPACHIIVRAKYMSDIPEFKSLGAQEVIPAEFETSIEIFSRVLTHFLVPRDEIEKLITDIRSAEYEMLRSISLSDTKGYHCHYSDMVINTFIITKESRYNGQKMNHIYLKQKSKAKLLAIKRGDDILNCLNENLIIKENDILILLGYPEDLRTISTLFSNK